MQARDDDRPTLVAHVDPDRCVSCGICAGSCAPMGIGPAHRTGRDQVQVIRTLAHDVLATAMRPQVVAICCDNAAPGHLDALRREGAVVLPVPCAGNLHSSVVELALRGGAGGVIVYACPPRDCRGREGPRWLHERLYHDREAELAARVDRRRVATATLVVGDLPRTLAALRDFCTTLSPLDAPAPATLDDALADCDRLPAFADETLP